MLSSIKSVVKDTPEGVVGEVFFASQKEEQKAAGNQRYREFFGFSEEQLTRIENEINEAIKGAI
jgi:hypothetical protein